jgi:hypothetical protein
MSIKFDKGVQTLLRRYGISEEAARYAGIYRLQNARERVREWLQERGANIVRVS